MLVAELQGDFRPKSDFELSPQTKVFQKAFKLAKPYERLTRRIDWHLPANGADLRKPAPRPLMQIPLQGN